MFPFYLYSLYCIGSGVAALGGVVGVFGVMSRFPVRK
jgi:hypothetical protein